MLCVRCGLITGQLTVGHKVGKCRPTFSNLFHWQVPTETVYVSVMDIFTSQKLRCYTTMVKFEITNNRCTFSVLIIFYTLK